MHGIYEIKFQIQLLHSPSLFQLTLTPFLIIPPPATISICRSCLSCQQNPAQWLAAKIPVTCLLFKVTWRRHYLHDSKIGSMAILLNIISLHCFCRVSTDPAVRELEWYLRDHLFRQSNVGNTSFERELLPQKMATLYLRYRNSDPDQLSNIMTSVIEILTAEKVVRQDSNELKLLGRMTRLQCVKCYYINYLTEVEPRVCLRCKHSELQDFPKRKAA
jgi:hypothetical protein